MSGCSGGSCGPGAAGGHAGGGQDHIEELVKATNIEEASELIREGHVLLAVYWNCARSAEEYVLGKRGKREEPKRRVGFAIS